MLCPTCYPADSPKERITQRYAQMTTISVGGKPHLKCNSCGMHIPLPEPEAPPDPLTVALAENATLRQRVAELQAEQATMADQGAQLMEQVDQLKTVQVVEEPKPLPNLFRELPIPVPTALPDAHSSVPKQPAD